MKGRSIRSIFIFFQVVIFSLFFTFSAVAHPGKIDKNGGHKNKKTGTYHYHSGKDRKVEYKTKQEADQSSKQNNIKQPTKPAVQPNTTKK